MAATQHYALTYPDRGEPMRLGRLHLQNNAETVDAALHDAEGRVIAAADTADAAALIATTTAADVDGRVTQVEAGLVTVLNAVGDDPTVPDLDAAVAGLVQVPSATSDGLRAGFARADALHSSNFPSLAALFAAATAAGPDTVIRIAPGVYPVSGGLRIEHSKTTLEAEGVTLVLDAAANRDVLTVAAAAQQVSILGLRIDGNKTAQTGPSSLLVFEDYPSPPDNPHLADRSTVSRVELLNAATDALYVGVNRRQVVCQHVTGRAAGRYGANLKGSDGTLQDCAFGVCDTGILVDSWTWEITQTSSYTHTTAAVRVTGNAQFLTMVGGIIDNNLGRGLVIEGATSAQTLNASFVGVGFQKNGQAAFGTLPDIYMRNARNVAFVGCRTVVQDAAVRVTSYAIDTHAGSVLDVYAVGNMWSPTAHALGIYRDRSVISTNLSDTFNVRADGVLRWSAAGATTPDTTLYRSAAGVLQTGDYFHANRLSVRGAGGAGFVDFATRQSPEPAVPSAVSAGRLYIRDVGGKGALCVKFPSGAVVQLALEP